AAQRDHVHLDTWANSLVRRLEILEQNDCAHAEYTHALEQRLATADELLRGYQAATPTVAAPRLARLRTRIAVIARRVRK
ncbi:MAG: hypothetical protein LC793_24950, partial [Thermomicrobia bacterium]|nr:hypothetical protein [Thermomicrobia bacterium]MCA1724187.1 hypothetical protein [Thermomicrobia bacterium]